MSFDMIIYSYDSYKILKDLCIETNIDADE